MIKFSKEIKKSEIIYTFKDMKVIVKRNPKWELSISKLDNINEFKLDEIINKVIRDLKIEEPICISFESNLESIVSYIVKLNTNSFGATLIYKVREDNIDNIRANMNTIKEFHLPIIINYVIPSNETRLDNILQTLKDLDEFYCLDDLTKSLFKRYSRNLNVVYLTKQLAFGICDDEYARATFLYYLDRFGFKTSFEGDEKLIESWKSDILRYYNNAYLLNKRRNLKVVQ